MSTRSLRQYTKIQQLPALQSQRNCTDIFCVYLAVALTVIMMIIAAVSFNYWKKKENYIKSNFPADSQGNLCGVDLKEFPYLYFGNLPEINQRVCVQQCPKKQDKVLKCHPTDEVGCKISETGNFTVRFYEAQAQQTRGGLFCWPVQQKLQQKIYQNSNLQSRNIFYNSIDTIIKSVFVALVLSILFFLLVQFFPYYMNFIVAILGSIVLFTITICVFFYKTELKTVKIILGCILIILLILSGFTIFKHYKSLSLHAIYLKNSQFMFKSRPLSLIYILLFFIMFFLVVLLIIVQFACFWTAGSLQFNPENRIYHELHGTWSSILTVGLFIQLMWGLGVVKEAFNFCISGNAIHWFLEDRPGEGHEEKESNRVKKNVFYPLKLLFTKHLGTVIASAFMNNGLFIFIDWTFDILKPIKKSSEQQNTYMKVYSTIFRYTCGCWSYIVSFVRSDILAYVNLTGNPYCNSARYCQLLCQRSPTVQFSQSSTRIYRLNSHILLMGITGVIALYMNGEISIYAEILIFIETVFISTLFVSYHADTAEAIQAIGLVIEELYCKEGKDFQALQKLGVRVEVLKEIEEGKEKRK